MTTSTAAADDTHPERFTVDDLKNRWEPHKERLAELNTKHPTLVRFHRACSWLRAADSLDESAEADLQFVSLWISLNSLYGRWDEARREPKPDKESSREFRKRVLELDQDCHVEGVLLRHKPLVLKILESEFLSEYFWEEPSDARARQSRKTRYEAPTWYVENNWAMILDRLIERVYLLRCQLMHGGATFGGKLNRDSIRWCSTALRHLLPAFLMVIIDRGADEDWGVMCYPPLHQEEKWR